MFGPEVSSHLKVYAVVFFSFSFITRLVVQTFLEKLKMLQNFLNEYQITDKVIAAGVSGGADSLALVLMLNEVLKARGKNVIALTVDHGLRTESSDEAAYVSLLMATHQIEHHILQWKGEKPQSGIEEAARNARYRLLCDWCSAHGVKTLATAHHLLDQAETFFMRLQRGSGLNGLCGMSAVSYMKNIKIIRPLLTVHPQKLRNYLTGLEVNWVEDPSNQCEDFLRVRVRKFLPILSEKLDITPERIADTMRVLCRSRSYLEKQTEIFIKNHAQYFAKAGVSLPREQFCGQHAEIKFRVLSCLLREIGKNDYTPRADDVERLLQRVSAEDFHGATLAGCEIVLFQKKIWIVPELKNKICLSKADWKAFVCEHPQYAKLRIPYKLKLSVFKSS